MSCFLSYVELRFKIQLLTGPVRVGNNRKVQGWAKGVEKGSTACGWGIWGISCVKWKREDPMTPYADV